MASPAGGGVISMILRTLGKVADLPMGGIVGVSVVSSATITFLSFRRDKEKYESAMRAQKLENGLSCGVCKGKGFYQCRLCKGNATIEWNPLYDPVFINPCLCPTCDGNRIQRCLNCLGNGYVSPV